MLTRKNYVKELREVRRMNWREIGGLLGVSRQRAHQIYNNYKSPYNLKEKPTTQLPLTKASEAVDYTKKERTIVNALRGRERTREMARIRDGHRCQICFRKWRAGRRFDVHHLNGECGKKSKSYDRVADLVGLLTLCHKCHLRLDSVKKKMREQSSPRPQKIALNYGLT